MLSNSLIEIGWLATITIHVLIFILLGWTLAVRGLRIATDRRRQAMVTIWRPILAGSLIEAPVSLPAIHPRDRVLFLYLWNHLQESIKGESSEELCKIIRRTKMDEVMHHFLVSGTMRQQLLAIVTLGHLKEESAWQRLLALIHAENAFLSIEAARTLVRIDATRAIPILVPLISHRADWSPLKVLSLLQGTGDELVARALGEAALNAPAAHCGAAAPIPRLHPKPSRAAIDPPPPHARPAPRRCAGQLPVVVRAMHRPARPPYRTSVPDTPDMVYPRSGRDGFGQDGDRGR